MSRAPFIVIDGRLYRWHWLQPQMSATSLSGTKPYFFKSLRINLSAARRPIAWSP
jgi:hypothetical protein